MSTILIFQEILQNTGKHWKNKNIAQLYLESSQKIYDGAFLQKLLKAFSR